MTGWACLGQVSCLPLPQAACEACEDWHESAYLALSGAKKPVRRGTGPFWVISDLTF